MVRKSAKITSNEITPSISIREPAEVSLANSGLILFPRLYCSLLIGYLERITRWTKALMYCDPLIP